MSSRSTKVSTNVNLKELEEKVKQARAEKKVFIILDGYDPIRQSLLARGWLEKVTDEKLTMIPSSSERYILALLLKNVPYNFVWQPKWRPFKNNQKLLTNTIIRQRNLDFTTKDGLHNCVENYRWHHIEGVTDFNYQRSHVLLSKTDRDEFSEDYRRTAITSFVMFLESQKDEFDKLFTVMDDGLSTDVVSFCCQKVELLLKIDEHEDIDTNNVFDFCLKFPKGQTEFTSQMRQITNGSRKFNFRSNEMVAVCKALVLNCARKINERWPHLRYDGYKNIWILKPIGQSQGYGITLMNNEEKILHHVQTSPAKFLIQKYIEKPLLISNRKFDLRIFFITFIRDGFVDVWLYRDCYAKFGTTAFSLSNLHRSIHVTNYAVQKYFMNNVDMVENARENMWHLDQLKKYLERIGEPNVWDTRIYPGIKKIILAMVLQSLEETTLEKNNFELNGADFMVGFDYQPIILEVNSRPALFFSKTIVEMMTNEVFEDLVKVTVDRQRDPEASTGKFELIHTHEIPEPVRASADLQIEVKKIEAFSARLQPNKAQPIQTRKIKFPVLKSSSSKLSVKIGKNSRPLYLRQKVK